MRTAAATWILLFLRCFLQMEVTWTYILRPRYVASSRLNENSRNIATDASAQAVSALLNQAARIAQSQIGDDVLTAKKNLQRDSVFLKFRSAFKRKVVFEGAEQATRYLSLPPSNYSLLNSAIVSKSLQAEDSFELRLPLTEIAAALDQITSSPGKYQVLNQFDLFLSLKVDVDAARGLVLMESGPLFFAPTTRDTVSSRVEGEQSADFNTAVADVLLPDWLVWNSAEINADRNVPIDPPVEENTDDLSGTNVFEPQLKSAVQPGLSIEMKWDPLRGGEYNEAQSVLEKARNFMTNSKPPADELIMKLKAVASLDLSLNINSVYSKALGFLPVRILLERAGSLLITTAMSAIAPKFIELLVKDYDKRFKNSSTNSSITINSVNSAAIAE